MGLPDHAMTFGNPDFVKLAEAFGAHGHRTASADVPIDYEANHRVLGEELRGLAAATATV